MGVNKNSIGDVLNYSLEFKGGTSTNVTFNEDLALTDIDTKVIPVISQAIGGGTVQAQKVQGSNEVIFKTSTLNVSQREAMQTALVDNFQVDAFLQPSQAR